MMTVQDRPLRVAFHTLGCRLNQYDTEGIKAALRLACEIEVVPWDDPADVYLLNSCTVTGKADQECRRLARQVKRRRPTARVVVAGCYAQTQPQSLAEIPEIDAVIGNTAKSDVARWLPDVLGDRDAMDDGPLVLVEEFDPARIDASPAIDEFEGRSRAFVKVQDGCDLRCAYCLIWKARGPARSRPVDAVLDQVTRLHREAGYNELILTGVHLGHWGRDLSDRPTLVALVEAVVAAHPDLRLRLSSIHPDQVTEDLMDLIASRPQLRPHLHVSLQSGSDTVLARMRRPYRRRDAIIALERAAGVDPQVGLGADVIVGFPGETDAEFAETCALVEAHPFSYLHVFRFSPRPGTLAAAMEPVHPETVRERSEVLRELAGRKRRAFLQSLVGQQREAVIEDRDDRSPQRRLATTENYATVTVDADLPAGTLVDARIERFENDGLQAAVTGVLREVSP
jgi:threonylcarbamoyladenosine tRNA methylthiotransferase MtaB